jgi:hypothetical protein
VEDPALVFVKVPEQPLVPALGECIVECWHSPPTTASRSLSGSGPMAGAPCRSDT